MQNEMSISSAAIKMKCGFQMKCTLAPYIILLYIILYYYIIPCFCLKYYTIFETKNQYYIILLLYQFLIPSAPLTIPTIFKVYFEGVNF